MEDTIDTLKSNCGENDDKNLNSLIPKTKIEGKEFEIENITSNEFEIVVGCGNSTVGKTRFFEKYFMGYQILSFNTKDKTVKAAKEILLTGKSIVIDNTNETVNLRLAYIKLAKQFNAKIRCIRFLASRDLAEHLNHYRSRTQNIKLIPTMVYNCFDKHFVEPTLDEGFNSITPVNFILDLNSIDKDNYYIPKPESVKKVKSKVKSKVRS